MQEEHPLEMIFYEVTVTAVKEEAPSTKSYFFDIPAEVTWTAGADMHVAFDGFRGPGGVDKSLVRHMSVTTLPGEGQMAFTSRVPGSGSLFKEKLSHVTPGDKLTIFKIGNRIPLRREGRPVVLISMGVGASTMRPMLLSYKEDRTGIPAMTHLVVDRAAHGVFQKDFEAMGLEGVMQVYTHSRAAYFEALEKVAEGEEAIFYIIGSDAFIETTAKRLMEKGIAPEAIELDKKPAKKAEILNHS